MLSFLLAELHGARVPFPAGYSTPQATPALPTFDPNSIPRGPGDQVSDAVGSVFGSSYSTLQNAAGNIDGGVKQLFDIYFAHGSPFFLILNAMTPIIALGVIAWSLRFIGQIADDPQIWQSTNFQYQFVSVFLTGVLLCNNGANLGLTVRAENEIVFNVNQSILNWSSESTNNKDAIRRTIISAEVYSVASALMEPCNVLKGSAYQKCRVDNFKQAIEAVKRKHSDYFSQSAKGFGALFNAYSTVINAGNNLALIGVLFAISSGFTFFIRISLLIWNLSSPIWLSLNLFPMRTQALTIYHTGLFGIGMLEVSFSLIQGLVAMSLTFLPATPLIIAVMMGGFAPILAIIIAGGSSTGVFFALSGTSLWIAKNVGSMAIGKFMGK